jgi:ATP-dependent Clp protease ATP-binding subunit ClpC
LLGGKSSQRRARLLCLFGEARRAENVILYLDDLHVLASAESEVGVMGVLQATLLVGYRSPLLAATTADGYRQLQESHPGLLSLFDTLLVQPQSREQTMEILRGLRERYETHHRVRIDDVALAAVVEAAETLPATRPLADRASLLLDRACARLRLREPGWQDLSLLDETIERFNQQKEEAVANQDFDTAARLRHEVEQLKQKREGACAEMTLPLDPGVIREVACAMSNRRSEL